MSATLALLDLPFSRFTFHVSQFISRVRRNHALEHATMHVLAERYRGLRLVGRSSLWGFYVYGDAPTEGILAAAQEGLRRLQAGRWRMAIHPQCGSNLVVGGTLAGLGAFVALSGKRRGFLDRIARLPLVFAAATLGLILAQPVGAIFQARVTTQPDVGSLRVVSVTREERAGIVVHHVRTEG
jgi:hypothetical protein